MVKVRNSTISSQFKQFSIRIHFKASYIILVGGERVITEESCPNQIKTQETGGGGEEAKVEADAYDEEASIVEAFLIEKVNGYEAHEFKEMTK